MTPVVEPSTAERELHELTHPFQGLVHCVHAERGSK